MSYPKFYDKIPTIKVLDTLSCVLGAFDNGEYEFSYLDIIKSAGHSCPTVAGAYIITLTALNALYPKQRAVRGNIKVEFAEALEDGVAGVIANVISQITGATDKSGFKGLQGKYARHSLMSFNSNINSSAKFTRIDTNKSVEVIYNPSEVKPNPKMMKIMKEIQSENATKESKVEFGKLFQDRVQRIFENIDSVVRVV
ncbi:MAG: FmdE family protein [Sulfurimonas sp.]|nr:FmdE family protein [Sulfurimonas sp.]